MIDPQGSECTSVYSYVPEDTIPRRRSTRHRRSRQTQSDIPISAAHTPKKRISRNPALMPVHKDKDIYDRSYDSSPVSDIEYEMTRPAYARRHTTGSYRDERAFDGQTQVAPSESKKGRFSRFKGFGFGSKKKPKHEEERPPLPERTWRSGIDGWLTGVESGSVSS